MNQAAEKPLPQNDRSTILYVEDEVLLRWATADELRAAGFSVIEAGTAEEAVTVVHSPVKLDVLLTDIRLPGPMDGMALAGFVRTARPGIKIVVASGHAPEQPRLVDAFLGKPYDFTRLTRRIRELLEGQL